MTLMTWTKEQYGTDVAIADEQHKKLFNLVNALHEVLPGGDKGSVGGCLDELIDFVAEHFQTEERLMQEKGYSGYEKHKAEHDKLLATCADIKNKFEAGETDLTTETTEFVKDWLDRHIPSVDRLYTPVLNG